MDGIGTTQTGHETWLTADERRQHAALLGASGVGKSSALESLAAQDIARGDGLLLLDVAGALAEAVLTHIPAWRSNHVCYLNVADGDYPVGINILEDRGADARAVVADAVVSAFRSIHHDSWGPRLEMILRYAVSALMEIPNGSLVLLPRLLTDERWRTGAPRFVKDPFTRQLFNQQFNAWRDSFRDEAIVSVLNKVEAFLAFPHIRNIIGQGRSTLHLEHAMRHGRIVIVNLNKTAIGETAAHLMGSLLLANALSKLSLAGGRDFHILVDEAHNFGGTQAVALLYQEARKHGCSVTLATQHLAALSESTRAAVLANAYSLICYRLGPEDAELLAPAFDRTHQAFNPYLLQHLGRGEAVARIGSNDAEQLQMPLPPVGRGNLEAIKKQSRTHYGNHREDVERKILQLLTPSAAPARGKKPRKKPHHLEQIKVSLEAIQAKIDVHPGARTRARDLFL